jgi:hypothetical protein
MFISIHIPKTAGTSLAYVFDYGSARRILYDYKDDYSNATMDDLPWWTQHKPFIERQFDFIHGHFFYQKYAELFPDGDFLACLRHPVERIISQFNHVYFEANPLDWQYKAIVENDLDIVDFATFDGVRDAQSRHLDGRAIEDYEFVFISEWLGPTLRAFQNRYTFGRRDPYMPGTAANGALPQMNVRTEKVAVTDAMKERIYEIAVEDVDLYIRGCARAEELMRQNGVSR